MDTITSEGQAICDAATAVDGLDPDAIERVAQFLSGYAQAAQAKQNRDRTRELQDRYAEEYREWTQEVRDAQETGQPIPPQPLPPGAFFPPQQQGEAQPVLDQN